jgi:hypothetical protein
MENLGPNELSDAKRLELDRAAAPFALKFGRIPWALCLPVLDAHGQVRASRLAALGASQEAIDWLQGLVAGDQ